MLVGGSFSIHVGGQDPSVCMLVARILQYVCWWPVYMLVASMHVGDQDPSVYMLVARILQYAYCHKHMKDSRVSPLPSPGTAVRVSSGAGRCAVHPSFVVP